MKNDKFLYCYKMTHDTGFAPNPYHGVLTLATCKPVIRRCAKKGYWISGWTSNVVYDKNNEKHTFTDDTQKLIYLARVSENPLLIESYWEQYPQKRQPEQSGKNTKPKNCRNDLSKVADNRYFGDNIYEPDNNETFGFKRHETPHHGEQNKEHDLSGRNVLICKEFYYFGIENSINIEGKTTVVHRCQKLSLDSDEAKNVIEFVTKNYSQGINPQKK